MIDISEKTVTLRTAVARGRLQCLPETVARIREGRLPKGNLFDVARAAALLAAKQTPALIPHCHPVPIEETAVNFETEGDGVLCRVTVRCLARTGPEMEAMTAVSVALLTVYDLLKPVDKTMVVEGLLLESKTGGKSGDFHHPEIDRR